MSRGCDIMLSKVYPHELLNQIIKDEFNGLWNIEKIRKDNQIPLYHISFT